MAHLKRLASCLLAVLLVITLIPGGVLTTAEAAANLEPEPVVNREDNVTLSKTAVQTAIDEWEVTLRISGGGADFFRPEGRRGVPDLREGGMVLSQAFPAKKSAFAPRASIGGNSPFP